MENRRCHIIVDMLNDFISGPMACQNAENAMTHILNYVNLHPEDPLFYVCDTHPAKHCSFVRNGGLWPDHCVRNTRGQEIHLGFYTRVTDPEKRPHLSRIYRKGMDPDKEQYSAVEAVRYDGTLLKDVVDKSVIVSGLATEYCVLETVKDLVAAEFDVQVLLEGLGYVTLKDHKAALETMKTLGVKFV